MFSDACLTRSVKRTFFGCHFLENTNMLKKVCMFFFSSCFSPSSETTASKSQKQNLAIKLFLFLSREQLVGKLQGSRWWQHPCHLPHSANITNLAVTPLVSVTPLWLHQKDPNKSNIHFSVNSFAERVEQTAKHEAKRKPLRGRKTSAILFRS